MQQKRLRQLCVGIGGASLCLLLLGARVFAQTPIQVQPVVVTSTVVTGVMPSAPVVTLVTGQSETGGLVDAVKMGTVITGVTPTAPVTMIVIGTDQSEAGVLADAVKKGIVITGVTPVAMTVTGTSLSEAGVLIGAVEPDGPAAKAGLARGDIILKVNDKPVNQVADLQALLANTKAGEHVTVTVQHGDATRNLSVTLGERKGKAFLGILPVAADLQKSTEIIRKLAEPMPLSNSEETVAATPTAQVLGVIKDGPADKAGLQAGDLIVSVNGKPLSPEIGLGGAIKALQPGDKITVEIERKDSAQTVERTIILGENPGQPKQAFLGLQVMPNVITLNKKFIRPMPGNQFMYAIPKPQENFSCIVISSPDATSAAQFMYSTPPMLSNQDQLVLSMPGLASDTVDHLSAAPTAPAEPQFFYNATPAQPLEPSSNPVQGEEEEDVTL